MKDRIPVNPGRVLITPENGTAAYYATMTRADNPTQEGDPLNKNTFLKDETAVLMGLDENAVPDDALAALLNLIKQNSEKIAAGVKIALVSYVGTGTFGYGSDKRSSITFPFEPKIVWLGNRDYTNRKEPILWAVDKNVTSWTYWYDFRGTSSNCQYKVNGNTLEWYSTESARDQYNQSGLTYEFVIIG